MDELPDTAGITKRQAKKLLKLLAALHEKAYRRGFQHGHLAGLGLYSFGPTPTEQQVAEWRFRGYDDAEPPPHGGHHKRKKEPFGNTNVDRMLIEVSSDDLDQWLSSLQRKCQAGKRPRVDATAGGVGE